MENSRAGSPPSPLKADSGFERRAQVSIKRKQGLLAGTFEAGTHIVIPVQTQNFELVMSMWESRVLDSALPELKEKLQQVPQVLLGSVLKGVPFAPRSSRRSGRASELPQSGPNQT